MGDRSAIEWTDATWNPVTGCSKVSPGCTNCYAERLALRFGWSQKPWTRPNAAENVVLRPERLDQPLRWRRPRKIFVCSMSDLFHEAVDEKFIAKVFAIFALAQHHTYQVLTKRPQRMAHLLNDADFQFHVGWFASQAEWAFGLPRRRPEELPPWPHPHVWIGTSVEDQRRADERIPHLLATPAAVRFLSCEPLLGPLDLRQGLEPYCWSCGGKTVIPADDGLGPTPCPRCRDHGGLDPDRIAWVIAGDESGPNRRPCNLAWVRSLRDQCVSAGVPFFLKQLHIDGRKVSLPELSQSWDQFPEPEGVSVG